MIKVGDLVRHKHNLDKLAQVTAFWDKRDIDPDCPESVAIIGMVRLMYINEELMGYESSVSRRTFSVNWEVFNDA